MNEPDKNQSDMSSDPEVQPVAQFIDTVIQEARTKDHADGELIDILEKHILQETPDDNAVSGARKEIVKLAGVRASKKQKGTEEKHDAGSDED